MKGFKRVALLLLVITSGLMMFAAAAGAADKDNKLPGDLEKYLQVPSPEWQDQIIYFIMTDRFNDGDPSNNNQGANEYDPTTNIKYSGGDLKGIIDKIDYVKNLGATTVWITPPIANQWWDPWVHYSGYHGYWASNFMEVDKHYGDLKTYKELSATLHKNGMYLIQDIVCNHVGNFMRYNGDYDPKDVTKNFELNSGSAPTSKPTQYPFSLNNVKMPDQKKAGIYNWSPDIKDFKDPNQVLTYQMSGLDDLNTKNPVVKNALKDSFDYWIKEVGVDGYRIDTVVYVDHDFWNDFVHSKDKKHLGVEEYAKQFGKKDFYTFGETWVNVTPYNDDGDIKASSYIGTKEKPEMTSVLNFPVHMTLRRVFVEGAPTSYMTYSLGNMFKYYRDPYKLLNFIDNHDMNRTLALAQYTALYQGLVFIMTIPGVPVIYYGTEQDFTESRGSMFAKGFGSGGIDNFDQESDTYKFIQKLTEIRKKYDVFRRGKITVLKDSKVGAGPFAYKMEYKGQTAVVVLNTADAQMLLDNVNTGLKEGTELKQLIGSSDGDLNVGEGGKLSTTLSPKAYAVYLATDNVKKTESNNVSVSVDNFKNGLVLANNLDLQGNVKGASSLLLVVDNNIEDAVKITANADGKWKAVLPVQAMDNGPHTMVVYADTGSKDAVSLSNTYEFEVNIPSVKSVEFVDKVGDDKGPNGNYFYPTDKSFKHQMDIEKVTLYKAGRRLQISLKMADDISTSWNPANGFDHVSFSIFISVPGKEGGAEELPFMNGKVKDGMKWNYMLLTGGWTNAVYESSGSSKTSFGSAVSPAPKLSIDAANKTVDIILSASSIGKPEKLEGIKLYIVTWDYDGLENSYRKLQPEPKAYIFGGGAPTDPMIMDDTDIIEVK